MAEPCPAVPGNGRELRDAMEHANLPSLVVVLYQLTGEPPLPRRPVPAHAQPGHGGQRPGRVSPARSRPRSARRRRRGAGVGGRAAACRARAGRATRAGADRARGRRAGAAGVRADARPRTWASTPQRPRRPRAGRRTSASSSSAPGSRACSPRSGWPRRASTTWCWRGTRRRRHLAGERLPRRGRRHAEPPLLVLVLRRARWSTHFGKRDEVPGLPARRRRRPRPARSIRFGTEVATRARSRRPALVDRHHRSGRDGSPPTP